LTPTAYSGNNQSATVGNEQGKYQENSKGCNCLNNGELGTKKDSLALAVTGENEMGRGGLEPPTHGFSVRCSKNTNTCETKTCETSKEPLTPQLTPQSHKQPQIDTSKLPPDLARIIESWPTLPDHIKAAIKIMVETFGAGSK